MGAVAQARHVFLAGNQLPLRWAGKSQFVILETGFGLGINFLATWAAWRADPQSCQTLHFVSIEKYPLRAADLVRALAASLEGHDEDEFHYLAKQLYVHWPILTPGMHRIQFEHGAVILTLAFGDIATLLPKLHLGADAFYLDGFSPSKNPHMWSLAVCKGLARCAREHATLATYTCAASVRAGLFSAGSEVEKSPGFGVKRSMLIGRFAPRWKNRRTTPPAAQADLRSHAIVIGAGLAGCATAAALARDGWQVTVLEQAINAMAVPCAHLRASLHPLLSQDDNVASRALRFGYEQIMHQSVFHRCGALQVAGDKAQAMQWQAMLMRHQFDPAFAQWLDGKQTHRYSGCDHPFGGIWYAQSGWVHVASICHHWLNNRLISARYGVAAARMIYGDGIWQVWSAEQTLLAQAPIVVMANALGAPSLLAASDLSATSLALRGVRGQLSYADIDASLSWPTSLLCGQGHVLPRDGHRVAWGASYDEHDGDNCVRQRSHDENFEKVSALLPGLVADALCISGGFVGQRCVTLDRMPLIGAWVDERAAWTQTGRLRELQLAHLPRVSGLYMATAFGSRGLAWAALAGDMIASHISGAPAPIETDLLNALDPARFLLRSLRAQ